MMNLILKKIPKVISLLGLLSSLLVLIKISYEKSTEPKVMTEVPKVKSLWESSSKSDSLLIFLIIISKLMALIEEQVANT